MGNRVKLFTYSLELLAEDCRPKEVEQLANLRSERERLK